MCDRIGCTVDAEWHPVVLAWAFKGHPPIQMVIGLKICGFCKTKITKVDEVLTDGIWSMLVDKLVAMGKAEPNRVLSQLDWTRLNSKLARQLGPRGLN